MDGCELGATLNGMIMKQHLYIYATRKTYSRTKGGKFIEFVQMVEYENPWNPGPARREEIIHAQDAVAAYRDWLASCYVDTDADRSVTDQLESFNQWLELATSEGFSVHFEVR